MSATWGYSSQRASWSDEAAERLVGPILRRQMNARYIVWLHRAEGSVRRVDTDYGVDALLHTPGRHIALAVRVRSSSAHKWHQVTLRDESLQTAGRRLETDKSIARFMFYGWADTDMPTAPTGLLEWYIFRLQQLIDGYQSGRILADDQRRNHDASSTFVCFDIATLKRQSLMVAGSSAVVPF